MPHKIRISIIAYSLLRIATMYVVSVILVQAVKNSIEWQVERTWGESSNIWKNCWQRLVDFFGNSQPLIFVAGTYSFGAVCFWIYHSVYLFMDMTERPRFLRRYKIQEGKNSPVTYAQLKKALGVILPSQAYGIPVTILMYPLQKWRGISIAANELPSAPQLVLDVLLTALIQAAMFFYTHRLLHHPFFYKRVHKVHHEWTAPISLIAVYAHPFEAVISNYIPIVLASVIVGCHLASTWVWLLVAIIQTANDHSGYHFPFVPSSQFHDYHHLKFNQCYGVFGILDHIHGTDIQFQDSLQNRRHQIFFSATPISEAIPDPPKQRQKPKAG